MDFVEISTVGRSLVLVFQVDRVVGEGWGDEWGDVTGHFNSLRLFPRCGVESCFEVPV